MTNLATSWRVHIPNYHPTRLNKLINAGKWAQWRLKKKDKTVIGYFCQAAGVQPAIGKRLVQLTIVLGPRQRADVDDFYKSTLDALKTCKAIRDDGAKWLVIEPVKYGRGPEPATIIYIEELT